MEKVKRFFQKLIRRLLSKLGVLPELKIIVNDDLSGLDSFTIKAQGFIIKPKPILINELNMFDLN